ncbi:MAG: hypothetical protein RLY16_1269 [Bacteroidota bacterium]
MLQVQLLQHFLCEHLLIVMGKIGGQKTPIDLFSTTKQQIHKKCSIFLQFFFAYLFLSPTFAIPMNNWSSDWVMV